MEKSAKSKGFRPVRSKDVPEPELSDEQKGILKDTEETREVGRRILNYTRDYMRDDIRNQRKKRQVRRLMGLGAFLLIGGIAFSVFKNFQLLYKDSELRRQIMNYQQNEISLNQNIENLQGLNDKAIDVLQGKVDELEKTLPVKGLFAPLERLVGGISLYNKVDFAYSKRIEELIQEASGYSSNPRELWDAWQLRTHGTQKYVPEFPWLVFPRIGDGKGNRVTQDFGDNVYIMVLGEGFHDGFDLVNKGDYKIYAGFDSVVIADSVYKGRGRTVTLEAFQRDEEGYYYRMAVSHLDMRFPWLKSGQKIKEGQQFGIAGNTGFTNGQKYGGEHAHVSFYRSKTKKSRSWEVINPFENGTYAEGERIVWFRADAPFNVPDSLKEYVIKQLK